MGKQGGAAPGLSPVVSESLVYTNLALQTAAPLGRQTRPRAAPAPSGEDRAQNLVSDLAGDTGIRLNVSHRD